MYSTVFYITKYVCTVVFHGYNICYCLINNEISKVPLPALFDLCGYFQEYNYCVNREVPVYTL